MQRGEPVFAPSLWPLEITNVLFNAERRKRIDKKHRDAALERVERLPISIITGPSLADLKTIRTLAEKHQLTAYDAEYLRVAKELQLPLATQDGNLVAAARREKVIVF
jgi:predicted nucleic acid-binding protein